MQKKLNEVNKPHLIHTNFILLTITIISINFDNVRNRLRLYVSRYLLIPKTVTGDSRNEPKGGSSACLVTLK